MNESVDMNPAAELQVDQAMPAGVASLSKESARLIRNIAMAIMIVPLFGFIEAIRLWAAGGVTRIDLWLFGLMYFVHMGGVTMGLHRMVAHRTFKTGKIFRAILMVAGAMAAQGPLLFWVATHRRHHAYSDQAGDPHSPNLLGTDRWSRIKGLWYAHMPWMLAKDTASWSHFGIDVLRDRDLFFYHRTYFYWVVLGLLLPTLAGGYFGGWAGAWSGFIFGGLARMFVANQCAWCVGSISHRYGSRPFATDDHSANNWLVAIVAFGEGLQNNHHAFASSYRHGVKWWEPDLSGWILTLLGRLGVVWELRSPTQEQIARLRKTSPHVVTEKSP